MLSSYVGVSMHGAHDCPVLLGPVQLLLLHRLSQEWHPNSTVRPHTGSSLRSQSPPLREFSFCIAVLIERTVKRCFKHGS